MSWRDIVAAFVAELGYELRRTVPPGTPVTGMPGFVYELLCALDAYDSPIDSTDLARAYGVTPTSLEDFVQQAVATVSTKVSERPVMASSDTAAY